MKFFLWLVPWTTDFVERVYFLYEKKQFKFRTITTWKFKESKYHEILQLTLKSTSVELQINQSYISIHHEQARHWTKE